MHLWCPIHFIIIQTLGSFEIAFCEIVASQNVQMQHAVIF